MWALCAAAWFVWAVRLAASPNARRPRYRDVLRPVLGDKAYDTLRFSLRTNVLVVA